MNRILSFLPRCCPECRDKQRLENRLDHVREVVAEIEMEVGTDIFEFCIPSAQAMLRTPEDEDDLIAGVRILVTVEPVSADLAGDLRRFAIDELRRVADELLAAAAKLEGTVCA